MALWDLLPEMEDLRREIDRAFQEFGSERWPHTWRAAFLPGRAARQYPLVNLSEDAGHVYVEALAPGVDPRSLEVSVVRDELHIKGEKPGLTQVKADAYHRNERAAGRFFRTVELPTEVSADKVRADYKNGLLLVTLPKSEAAKARQVPVSVG